MYCPQCGEEYRDDVAQCSECGVALVADPPLNPPAPRTEWSELETVLATGDSALLAVARSLLEAEGIPCFSRGEVIQDFLGWGRLPLGVNLITGPVQLQVPSNRSEEARALLAAVDTRPSAETDED